MCLLSSLFSLAVTNLNTNPGIGCVDDCFSVANIAQTFIPSRCPTEQETTLCGLIASTNIAVISGYDNWQCTVGGLVSSDPCDSASSGWTGLGCSGGGVISVTLTNIGLAGSLTSSIGQLDALTRLQMQGGCLSGSIPTEIGQLTKLGIFDLFNNSLTGKFPTISLLICVIIIVRLSDCRRNTVH